MIFEKNYNSSGNMCLPISQTEEKTVKKLLLLVAVLAVVLPEATYAVTNNNTASYNTNGISLEMFDPAGSVYQQGESVSFAVRSDRDAYVVVFNIDTEGYVHLLYPRNSKSIQSFVGGVSYSIPTGTDMDLLVTGKTGIEFVFAVSISDRSVINTDQLATLLQDETRPSSERYRVTGDPFLAANRIANRIISGIAYTKDESIAYTYFYVNAAVDYPRYLCLECEAQGQDPYSRENVWVATSAFDNADRLSYPLQQAFVRADENVALENPGGTAIEEPATVVNVYNNYYDRYPYYPGYYRPYWGSSFYFSVGWNWGWGGWGWGYPVCYPRYAWHWAYWHPRPTPYYRGYGGWRGHHGYGHAVAYRPTLRPRSGTRVKGGAGSAYRSKTQTASRLRSKSMRYERTDKLGMGASGGTRIASAGGAKSRPVYKVASRPTSRTGTGKYSAKKIRPTTGSRQKTGKGYTLHSGTRPVRTIKGQPTKRRTVGSRAVRGTSGSKTRARGTLPRVKSGSGSSRGWSGDKRPTRGPSRVKSGSSPRRSYSKPTTRRSSGSSRVKSGSSPKRSYSKPTTRRSSGSSRSAVRRSAPRSGSRSGSAARSSSRGRSGGGGRRK
jgi:hypothetical protein